jgi:hypothetical protein
VLVLLEVVLNDPEHTPKLLIFEGYNLMGTVKRFELYIPYDLSNSTRI